MNQTGPSFLLMRESKVEYIDPRTQPEQLSFWPEEVRDFKLVCPGPEYPWRFHEIFQTYKARCYHPALAAILAHEDVEREESAMKREEEELRPPLFAVA